MTDAYIYPAPGEYADGDEIVAGYYHTDETMDLINSTPSSSPLDNMVMSPPPPPAVGNSTQDRGPSMPLAASTFNSTPLPREPTAQVNGTNLSGQFRSIYSQDLSYGSPYVLHQDQYTPPPHSLGTYPATSAHIQPATYNTYATGPLLASLSTTTSQTTAPRLASPITFTTPLQTTTTYPYRPPDINPTILTTTPTLSLPPGPNINHPLPPHLLPVIAALNALPKIGHTGHPERRILKKPFEGSYASAPREAQLIRDHFASGSGLLRGGSELRAWYGDGAVFGERMWEFLAVQRARK